MEYKGVGENNSNRKMTIKVIYTLSLPNINKVENYTLESKM